LLGFMFLVFQVESQSLCMYELEIQE